MYDVVKFMEKMTSFFSPMWAGGEQIISSDTNENGDEKNVLFQHQRVGVHHLDEGVFFDAVVDHHASKIVVT